MFKGIKRISAMVMSCVMAVGLMGAGQSEGGLAVAAKAYDLEPAGVYRKYEAPQRDWAPLTGCEKVLASNQEAHFADVQVGNWYARSGKLKNSVRFCVSGQDSYRNTHYIIYNLKGNYTQMTGLASFCDKSADFAEAEVRIYLDNELAYESITLSDLTGDDEFTLDVEDVRNVRIVCSTTGKATAYCVVAASVR